MKKRIILVALFSLAICLVLCSCGVAPTGYADDSSVEIIEPAPRQIVKDPISETVEIGGRASFIAHANFPASPKWYFVDTSGITYSASELHSRFLSLIIEGHSTDVLVLSNIPAELNNWSVYANYNGITSNHAVITVVAPNIKITKHPTSETIAYGTSTSFIAKAENATYITWYATKDGKTYLASELSATACPGAQLLDYDKEKLIIRNAGYQLSGWQFFACFDGINGPIYSDKATLTVYTPTYPNPSPCCPPCRPYPIIISPCAPPCYCPTPEVNVQTSTTTVVTVH